MITTINIWSLSLAGYFAANNGKVKEHLFITQLYRTYKSVALCPDVGLVSYTSIKIFKGFSKEFSFLLLPTYCSSFSPVAGSDASQSK